MWLLYLYFIREALVDVYSLIEDSLAWAFAGAERPSLPTISRLLVTLEDYGIVIMANGAILVLWALNNQFRFRGRDRHLAHTPVSVAELAALYGRPAKDIANWQQSRILVMQHAPDGTLVSVVSKDPGHVLSTRESGSRLETN